MSSLLNCLLRFLLQLMKQDVCFSASFYWNLCVCLSGFVTLSPSLSLYLCFWMSLSLCISPVSLSLSLSVCVCMWREDAHICVYAYWGQGSLLDVVSLSIPKPYVLKQDLSLNLELINWLDWPAGESSRSSRLCLLVLGLPVCFSTMFSFSMWASRF